MRWYFREDDLHKERWLFDLFCIMRPMLEYDPLRCIWIMKREVMN